MVNELEKEVEVTNVIDVNTLTLLQKGEIDSQVATAKKYPRSIKSFRAEALDMVTLTEEVAQECIYALPRAGKTIEGASARFAEIILSAWGNARAGARVIDEGNEFVTSQGVFHDLEKNTAITYESKRRIVDKYGKRYQPDMIAMTANAACSVALRNAILKGVPKAFWKDIYDSARKIVMGDSKTLGSRRAEAIGYLQKFGVTSEMICETLEVKGIEDIGLDDLVVLKGLATSIKDGETTIEQVFKKPEVKKPKSKSEKKKENSTVPHPETSEGKVMENKKMEEDMNKMAEEAAKGLNL